MTDAAAGTICVTLSDPAATDHEVWQLVGQAWPEEERTGQLHAIADAIQNGEGGTLRVLAAHRTGRLVGACFAQLLRGRAAVVSPPQIRCERDEDAASVARLLLRRLEAELQAAGMQLAQLLLPHAGSPAAAWLREAGYARASDLLYLFCGEASFPTTPPPLPFELEAWNPTEEERLIQILDRTYAGTLDCPQIDGLRQTADVLRGYRATGEFRPELWNIVRHAGVDVGCLILAWHPGAKHCEVVYLGLAPEVRGRGWGLGLTRSALWLAGRVGAERVVLAVDATNEPAVRMYVAAGFAAWDRRQLWIKPLKMPK